MRGCSSIALNTGAAPSTENAKSGQVLVRTRGGEKGRPVAAPDEPLLPPDGAVPRSPQTLELRTFNGKRKKRTGFGSHPGRRKRQASGGSGQAAAATMWGCSSIAPNTGAAYLQRKTQKSGQVLVRTREDKTESIDYFKGGMSGVLKLVCRRGVNGRRIQLKVEPISWMRRRWKRCFFLDM